MVSVLVHSLPRSLGSLTKSLSQVARSKRVRLVIASGSGITVNVSSCGKPLHSVDLHGVLTVSRFGSNKDFNEGKELTRLGGKRDRRRICSCKSDKASEDNVEEKVDALLLLLPLIGTSNVSTACLIGVTGVLAPLYEETVFRGFLMTSFTKWLPTPVAVLLSASVFALAHCTPGEFPQLFMLGTVLGFSYAQTRNLLTPMTIHSLWNSGVIIFLTILRLQGYDIQEFVQ